MIKKLIDTIKNLGLVGVIQYIFPEAGKDAVVTGIAWAAYWFVRIVRTKLKAEWALQGIIKRCFAGPLTIGAGLDLLWEILNPDHSSGRRAPWYLNWIPVAWVLLPWILVKPLCVLALILTFWDVIFQRVKGAIAFFKGLAAPTLPSGGDGSDDPFSL